MAIRLTANSKNKDQIEKTFFKIKYFFHKHRNNLNR
jgi:hypothetical protein